MIDGIVVVDSGSVLETTESAIIAKDEADRAEKWAKYSEEQANLSSDSAIAAVVSRDAAAQSAQSAANTVDGFDIHASEKQAEFDVNAVQKTNDFNQNAAQKQAAVDASANAAAQSEDNAEIWAEGTDEQVQALGGVHSSKGWADQSSQGQVQTDWNQSDSSKKDFIKNKPTKLSQFQNDLVLWSGGNLGDIKYTTRTDVPNGGAWCDGAEYTQAMFPDIYQMLVDGKIKSTTVTDFDGKVSANGSCGFFGLDTANERFKVPLLKDVYIKAGQAPSMFGAESLPNISGEFRGTNAWNGNGPAIQTGALYSKGGLARVNGSQQSGYNTYSLNLDASRSSSTYQDGAKVNPDHVTYRAYVVLYASAAEASVAQAQEFMTALSGKANVDLSNVSSNIDYIVKSKVNSDGSWYRKYKSGWLEQGGIGLTVVEDGTKTVTLIKPFKDTKYIVNWLDQDGFRRDGEGSRGVSNKTTTSFVACNGQDKGMNIGWIAIGQGA